MSPSDAIWRQRPWSSFVKVMAVRSQAITCTNVNWILRDEVWNKWDNFKMELSMAFANWRTLCSGFMAWELMWGPNSRMSRYCSLNERHSILLMYGFPEMEVRKCFMVSVNARRIDGKAPVTHTLQPVGDLLATKISSGRREVAGRLQGGRRLVADRLQTIAGTIWSQGGFGCCKWNLSATKSIVERFLVVADRSPNGWRPIADQLQRLQTIPTQFLVADWSPTSRRSVADRSPKSCRLYAVINKRLRYSQIYKPFVPRTLYKHCNPLWCNMQ